MTIDYKQLKTLVIEAMFTGGGINEPSAPEGVPHRMPAANTSDKEQDLGDEKANSMYDIALVAREATEELVEALDEPIFDGAYEHAFKASSCLRRALNSIEEAGAHPMPDQRVVAPPAYSQKYAGGGRPSAGDFAGGTIIGMSDIGFGGMREATLGAGSVTQSAQARKTRELSSQIASGETFAGLDDQERKIIDDVMKILMGVANVGELQQYRPQLQTVLKSILARSAQQNSPADDLGADDLGTGA